MTAYRALTNLRLGEKDERGHRIRRPAGSVVQIADPAIVHALLAAGAIEAVAAPVPATDHEIAPASESGRSDGGAGDAGIATTPPNTPAGKAKQPGSAGRRPKAVAK